MKRPLLIIVAVLATSIALARSEGIYNPSSNAVGDYQGIDSNKPASGSTLACSYSPVTTGTQSVAYTGATPAASGGTPAYTFSETGALPTGLTINTANGVISGTPSISGTFAGIQVKVTDSLSAVVNCGTSFTLVISSGAATLAFQSFATEAVGGASGTFGAVGLGTTAANRVIVVIAIARTASGSNTLSSVTVGGNAATQVPSAASTLINSGATDVWYYADAGALGASATIVTNWSLVNSRSGIYVYRLTTSTPTPSAGNNASSLSVTSLGPTSITIPASGVGVAGLFSLATGNTQSFTNATVDSSNPLSGGNASASGTVTGTGSVAVTGTSSPASNSMMMSLAGWGP